MMGNLKFFFFILFLFWFIKSHAQENTFLSRFNFPTSAGALLPLEKTPNGKVSFITTSAISYRLGEKGNWSLIAEYGRWNLDFDQKIVANDLLEKGKIAQSYFSLGALRTLRKNEWEFSMGVNTGLTSMVLPVLLYQNESYRLSEKIIHAPMVKPTIGLHYFLAEDFSLHFMIDNLWVFGRYSFGFPRHMVAFQLGFSTRLF